MDNLNAQPNPAAAEAPVETSKPDAYAQPGTVLVIPRVFFNYAVIAVVFFALGAVLSAAGMNSLFNANSQENQRLVGEAVATAVAAGGGVDTADARQGLQPGQTYEVVADDDPALGPEDAPVTIIEFSDFRCPYCARFANETFKPLVETYGDRVRFVFRDFPILGQQSVLGALAGECADDQEAFWGFHDLAYANQQNLTREAFIGYADQLGLDVEQFTTCLDEQTHIGEIQADYLYAQNLGATGTPAFFVNGRFVSGAQPFAVFADIINQELAKAGEATPEAASS